MVTMSTVIANTKQFAPAGSWSADPVHSHVSFEVGYAGVNTFRGAFRDFFASVDVKDEQLNGHLQTPDFFDTQRYPEIAFKATELRRLDDNRVEGKGEL